MWKIKQIAEADFGCEERLPGEKLKCLVILENENGETRRLEVEDEWLTEQGLDEGSTWNITDEKIFSESIQIDFISVEKTPTSASGE